MTTLTRQLKLMVACDEAVEWAKNYPDLNTAWQACERGDWMLWFASKMSGKPGLDSRRKLVGAAADCGRTGLPYAAEKDMPLLLAVFDLCEGYAQGVDGITVGDLQIAADAAHTAAYAARASDAAHTAAYAARASDAAYTAAYAAYTASYAAYTAAYATYTAAYATTLKQCADIMRQHYPVPPQKES